MVVIRPRTIHDLPDCIVALREVHEIDGYPAVWPEDPAGWLAPSKFVATLVAEIDGAVVGQVGLGDSAIPAAVQRMLPNTQLISVIRLYVAPPSRGHGVGMRLLDAAAATAEALQRKPVLNVETGAAAAIALYERTGWMRVHSQPDGWTTPDGRAAFLHHYVGPSPDRRPQQAPGS
ncbi:GNAT family N-acetyltransferase [Nocardia sp. NPDC051463]|uniref:GNAT family N-acetyltransferase n=1 Tax=Nocardia sp. NPDC051463 TaxID=3154845 RepID=UPI00344D4522